MINSAFADCNLNLIIASGKCSSAQIAKIEKAFNLKEVHGNYCQPHRPPPQKAIHKDLFMKGADLYSWKDFQGFQWYALLPGTNRTKSTTELIAAKSSEWRLHEQLKHLPPFTEISWNNLVGIEDSQNLEFSNPPRNVVSELTKAATKAKLKLEIPIEQ